MPTHGRTTAERKNVLVVEDERVVARDLQRTLERLGYSVPRTVDSADDAIASASERCPDLVLMDIRIRGGIDGIDAARILRTRFGVPVVFLTAYADDDTVARAAAALPYGYLIKPVGPDELRSAIEIALDKHAAERALREREQWLATTLRSIGDAVLSTDADGRVTYMNPAAEVLTGWSQLEAHGRRVDEVVSLVDGTSGGEIESPVRRAIREGRSVRGDETRLEPRDGAERSVADAATPILDDTGRPVGAVLVLRDVSEQKRLRAHLELSQRLTSLGTLTAGVAHEINSPLAAVLANVTYVLETLESARPRIGGEPWLADVDEALRDAQEGARRIARIVRDLSAFSRTSDGGDTRVDVAGAVRSAVQMVGRGLRDRARITLEVPEGLPAVRGDETRLAQVIVNLLTNAGEAIHDASRASPGTITVRALARLRPGARGAVEEQVVIEVRDDGCGMSPEVQRRAFEPFFSTRPRAERSGLGLAISHGIVRSMGGDIEIESEPGVGSTFRVVLPSTARSVSVAPPDDAPRARVLLADDEPLTRDSLARALARSHDVHAASCDEAAQRIERGERFDVILVLAGDDPSVVLATLRRVAQVSRDQLRRMVVSVGDRGVPALSAELAGAAVHVVQGILSPLELAAMVGARLGAWGRAI